MSDKPSESQVVEHRLYGRDANLDGAVHWLNRRLQGSEAARLQRIEVRHPVHAAPPIDRLAAQERIRNLCLQKGVTGHQVSVRPHELPLDREAGHLTIRLKLEPLPGKDASEAGARAWWSRLLHRLWGDDEDTAGPVNPASLETQQAVDKLRQKLDLAAEQFRAGPSGRAIGCVVVIVNSPALHQVLAPKMPPADTANATLWFASELESRQLQPVAGLTIHYRFQAPLSESTNLVDDEELNLRLLAPGQAPAFAPANTGPAPTDTPMPTPGSDTPLPLPDIPSEEAAPAVALRILGTWRGGQVQPLAQPFECLLGAVPTQFSRSALEMLGFSKRPDGATARAASNSTPLGFARDGAGGIKLHAAPRPGGQPMYFFAKDLSPCVGEHPLTDPIRLVVNGPTPLQDGLLPLVIEVSPAGPARPA